MILLFKKCSCSFSEESLVFIELKLQLTVLVNLVVLQTDRVKRCS